MPKNDVQCIRGEIQRILSSEEVLEAMCKALSSGDKVEIVSTKQGVKILRVRKGELNMKPSA